MICVRGIRIPLKGNRRLDGNLSHELPLVEKRALALLRLDVPAIRSVELLRRSIDARGSRVFLEFSIGVTLKNPKAEPSVVGRLKNPRIRLWAADVPSWPTPPTRAPLRRPIVVGAGAAGLFCALGLAHAGLQPLLIEQGDDCAQRSKKVRSFAAGGPLDPFSNVQFGLGGAGTFSDGKLATGTKDPSHRLILEAFHAAGAPSEILYNAHPHIGSDRLPGVVERLVALIEELGGEVRTRTRLVDLKCASRVEGRKVQGVALEQNGSVESVGAHTVVLACGHSARDVYELLKRHCITLEAKSFAVGVRIEHLQADVDRALYGPFAGHPALGAAPYRAVAKTSTKRRCFTFCMCPGGQVMAAASEPGGIVTNGASDASRSGANANAGLLVGLSPDEFLSERFYAESVTGSVAEHLIESRVESGVESVAEPFSGIALQRAIEQAAFEQGGGTYRAPAQLVGDFIARRPSQGPKGVLPSYPRGVEWGDVSGLFPAFVSETLREALPILAHKLTFFGAEDAVLSTPETRSSSPVRIPRGRDLQHPEVRGLYPVGEGGGWAGGIMSAAADGLRAARAIVDAC